jgi:hypothetical protein
MVQKQNPLVFDTFRAIESNFFSPKLSKNRMTEMFRFIKTLRIDSKKILNKYVNE